MKEQEQETAKSGDRWATGMAMYQQIYGEDAIGWPQGQSPMFDLMIEQLFAEVWSRPGLSIPVRRLLTLGVLAAQYRFEVVELQFTRALHTGELTEQQVREIVIHLIPYVGYPSSGDLLRAGENAIAAAAQAGAEQPEGDRR
jgi:4-carboxymuconolactone decarboxylase